MITNAAKNVMNMYNNIICTISRDFPILGTQFRRLWYCALVIKVFENCTQPITSK